MARKLNEILNDRNIVTAEMAERIETSAMAEAQTYWGGKRAGAGRKAKQEGCPRNKQIKVSDGVKLALQYAYENGIILNIDDINILKYIRENSLTLDKLRHA